MKKTSTKLFLAAAALGFAAVTTVGSTYAWFTVNGSAKATGLSMNVAGGSGIMIRKHVESGTQNSYTDKLDLAEEFPDSKVWNACTPASTSTDDHGLESFKTLDLSSTLSTLNVDNKYKYKTLESLSGYVYTLDLDVRVSNDFDFVVYTSFVASESDETALHMARKALRVAVVEYGANNSTATGYSIYGIVDRSNISSETGENDKALKKFNAAFNKNIVRDSSTYVAASALNSTSSHKVICNSNVKDDESNGYTTERVTIKVWYDGDDPNCSDDILSQSVKFDLNLEPVKHTA